MRDRTAFGAPIGDFQGMRWKLADMYTRHRGRPRAALPRLRQRRPVSRSAPRRDRQDLLQRDGDPRHQRGDPGARRLRLHRRVSRCRASTAARATARLGGGTSETLRDLIGKRLMDADVTGRNLRAVGFLGRDERQLRPRAVVPAQRGPLPPAPLDSRQRGAGRDANPIYRLRGQADRGPAAAARAPAASSTTCAFPALLEAAFVRSPHAHALIRGIDASAARARARRARGAHARRPAAAAVRRSGCRCSSAPRSCRPTSRRSSWPRTRSPSSARRWRW